MDTWAGVLGFMIIMILVLGAALAVTFATYAVDGSLPGCAFINSSGILGANHCTTKA